MRRGQTDRDDMYGNAVSGELGWTKGALMEAADISAKTFDLIRKAARIRGPSHGGLNWIFSVPDLITLVRIAEGGRFTERGKPAAEVWRGLMAEAGVKLPGE